MEYLMALGIILMVVGLSVNAAATPFLLGAGLGFFLYGLFAGVTR